MKRCLIAAFATAFVLCGCVARNSVAEKPEVKSTEPEVVYSDYESFAADYEEKYPSAYEMPLPESSEDMKMREITLGNGSYTVSYDTDDVDEINVIVEYSMTGCVSIDGLIAAQNYVPDSEIIEKNESYFIRKYSSGEMELTMLSGENNTVCKLSVCDDNSSDEELKKKLIEYMQELGMKSNY